MDNFRTGAATHRFEESDELRLVVEADSFAAVAAEAGEALADLSGEPSSTAQPVTDWREVQVEAGDPAGLLVEWLNELIFLADFEGQLACRFEVIAATPERLVVRVATRSWPSRSFPVKAATLDRASVTSTERGVRAEVTLDV